MTLEITEGFGSEVARFKVYNSPLAKKKAMKHQEPTGTLLPLCVGEDCSGKPTSMDILYKGASAGLCSQGERRGPAPIGGVGGPAGKDSSWREGGTDGGTRAGREVVGQEHRRLPHGTRRGEGGHKGAGWQVPPWDPGPEAIQG